MKLPDWLKPDTLRTGSENVPGLLNHYGADICGHPDAKWKNWGIVSNGKFLTAQISAYRRQESACTLSDILMNDVEEKYFLSPKEQALLLYSPALPRG